ncbi:MAG: DUF2065 domain-containing protein [Porticoccaceae bacterium]|nr:DUF2065 domain-containing protein [Porticoccaceae bacterium]
MTLDLAKALCLVLVIEGIMPFVAPRRWRNLAQLMAQIDDRTMRIMGFTSMVLGAVLLFFLK